MKKYYLLLCSLCSLVIAQAQTTKQLYLDQGGTLNAVLNSDERQSVTDLTLLGHIDARDFKTMRDSMPSLQNLNLSETTIDYCRVPNGTGFGSEQEYAANSIPQLAFQDVYSIHKLKLLSIVLPKSCEIISRQAFSGNAFLKSVELNDNLIAIGSSAFSECSNLRSVRIPQNVNNIDMDVFNGCVRLSSLTVDSRNRFYTALNNTLYDYEMKNLYYCCNPEDAKFYIEPSVSNIYQSAFNDCKNISLFVDYNNANPYYSCENGLLYNEDKSILILCPQGVTGNVTVLPTVKTIGTSAFYKCSLVTEVQMPNSVTEIGYSAFVYCSGLQKISIPDSVSEIKEGAFYECSHLENITFPQNLVAIHDVAFYSCLSLRGISIPHKVNHLGNSTFLLCSGLKYLKADNPIPIDISTLNQILDSVPRSIPLFVPIGAKAAYQAAAVWKEFSNIIETPDSTEVIYTSAGQLKDRINDYSIKHLKLIGEIDARDYKVINRLDYLSSIDLENVRIVAYTGTEGTVENQLLTYPANTVPKFAFNNGYQIGRTLSNVVLPSNVTEIDDYAFRDCFKIRSIRLPAGLKRIGRSAFSNTKLMNLELPNSLIAIGEEAFAGNTFETVVIPNSVTQLGLKSFFWNDYLKSFTFPSSITTIPAGVVSRCPNLKSCILPSFVDSVQESAFAGCYGLENLRVPNTVKYVGNNAFICRAEMDSLPASLEYIGWAGFSGVHFNDSLSFPHKLQTVNPFAFGDSFKYIQIPASTTKIAELAFNQPVREFSVSINNPSYCSVNGVLYNKDTTRLINCGKDTLEYTIPASVTRINDSAIYSKLHVLRVMNPEPPQIISERNRHEFNAFPGINTATCVLYVPIGSKILFEKSPDWGKFDSIVEMGVDANIDTLLVDNQINLADYFEISSNMAWEANTSDDWLQISDSSKSFDSAGKRMISSSVSDTTQKLWVMLKSNPGRYPVTRYGTITLTANGFKKQLVVKQTKLYEVDYVSRIKVSDYPVRVSANDTAFSVQVSYYKNWTAHVDVDWLRFSRLKTDFLSASPTLSFETTKDTTVEVWILIDRNLAKQNRFATFIFSGDEEMGSGLPILQKENTSILVPQVSISTEIVQLDKNTTSASIEVTNSVSVTASSDTEWLQLSLSDTDFANASSTVSLSSVSGTSNALWIVAAKNTSSVERTGTVSIISGDIVKRITVKQAAVAEDKIWYKIVNDTLSYKQQSLYVLETEVGVKVSCNQPWLNAYVVEKNDDTGYYIGVAVQENTGAARSADITLTLNGKVLDYTIIQKKYEAPTLKLSTHIIDLSIINTAQIQVSSDGAWSASSDQSWVTISPASGSGDGKITITAQPNTSGQSRTATITVASVLKADGTEQTIIVSQAAGTTAFNESDSENEISIYPNPSSEIVTIRLSSAEKQIVSLVSPNGTIVATQVFVDGKAEFWVKELIKGVYMLTIQSNNHSTTKWFVVE